MKKTYMQPTVEVVKLMAESLICESIAARGDLGSDVVEGNLIEERLFGDFQPEAFSFLW